VIVDLTATITAIRGAGDAARAERMLMLVPGQRSGE
jgi:hypothetical protein